MKSDPLVFSEVLQTIVRCPICYGSTIPIPLNVLPFIAHLRIPDPVFTKALETVKSKWLTIFKCD